jgi:gluconolactonase
VWTTSAAGIQVFASDGTRLGLIRTPNLCANCDFGGADRRRLFIAAEHMLLAIDLR